MDAEQIARTLGGRRQGGGWLCRCPVSGHGRGRGDRSPSLSVADGEEGTVLVYCHAGCDPRDVLAELRRWGLLDENWHRRPATVATFATGRQERQKTWPRAAMAVSQLPATVAAVGADENVTRTKMAADLWRQARPAAGTSVAAYLRHRGISVPPPESLRFATLRHGPSGVVLPTMVAAVQDVFGAIVAVHRTFLAAGGCGKAAVVPNKMMLGPTRGSGVWLGSPGSAVLLSEGIESGLAAMELYAPRPACATLSTSGMRTIVLPSCVREVLICADGDPPGLAAAHAAADRLSWEGRQVAVARPPASTDFNDLLLMRASA